MEEKAMAFNEGQLKKSGFAEAYTPELQKKMEERVPVIEHRFSKEYEGDKVDATLHLKKSSTSDYYFLNKFDLQLQKAGQVNTVRQTFFITRRKESEPDVQDGQQPKAVQKNRYTLKEGYNLLAGRPVYKHMFNKEGESYDAWMVLNQKNKLANGNFEMKPYTKNYGFELEKVLSNYTISELGNEKFKQSLVDSLQRGNLQKASFVTKDGHEEKLYISPDITNGALKIYDLNKQRVPTEKLVQNEYIGKDLANKLKEQLSQLQKPKEVANKSQKQAFVQNKDSSQKQAKKDTIKQADPKPKQSRKNKIS